MLSRWFIIFVGEKSKGLQFDRLIAKAVSSANTHPMLRSYIEAIEHFGWIFFPEVVSFVKEGGSIVSCNGSGLLAHYNWSVELM